jgi:hypothetical protein
MKRLAPVFTLFLLSPLIAEYLSGSMSMAQLDQLLILLPFYGSGAVLVREIARRSGRGWLALPFLALAYGLIEEGVILQSLFNPNFLGLHLLAFGYLPQLGMGGPWTVFVLGIHILWSIVVPVALTEALFAARRTQPWLGKIGLGVVAVIYGAISTLITSYMASHGHFWAASAQLIGVALAVVVAIVLAFVLPKSWFQPTAPAWPAWSVALIAFLTGSAFILVYGQGSQGWHWPWQAVVGTLLALLIIMFGSGLAALRSTGWNDGHRFAATAGGLLVYCWSGFGTDAALHGSAMWHAHAALVVALLLVWGMAGWQTVQWNHLQREKKEGLPLKS